MNGYGLQITENIPAVQDGETTWYWSAWETNYPQNRVGSGFESSYLVAVTKATAAIMEAAILEQEELMRRRMSEADSE